MSASRDVDARPLVWAGLGSALLATAIAASALLSESGPRVAAPLGLGALSLLLTVLPLFHVRARTAALVLSWTWTVGATGLVFELDAASSPALVLTAVGPLLALVLVGRREALAAGAIAFGATCALSGAALWQSSASILDGLLGPLGVGTVLALAYVASSLRTRATQSARRAGALLESVPDTILRLDARGRVLDGVWRSPLTPPRTWRGQLLVDVVPQLSGLGRLLGPGASDRAQDFELLEDDREIARGRTPRRITVEARAGRARRGERVLVLRDVTSERAIERKRLERERDEQEVQSCSQVHVLQAGRLAHMGVLATGVAHEINNPLAFVLSNLEYARDGLAAEVRPPDLEEALGEAIDGARRIRDIVEDIGMFSRADDSDHLELAQLADVASSAIRVVRGELGTRVQLSEEHQPAPPVFANPSRLAQVVVNLLVNAIQAIPAEREGAGHIKLRTGRSSSGEAFVEVEDDGVGIRDEHRRRIFEPFFTTRPIGQGTGLGLSICYGLVRRLGGTVDVESEEGRGSTFRIRLPNGEVLLDAS